jgi:hypothetical protein
MTVGPWQRAGRCWSSNACAKGSQRVPSSGAVAHRAHRPCHSPIRNGETQAGSQSRGRSVKRGWRSACTSPNRPMFQTPWHFVCLCHSPEPRAAPPRVVLLFGFGSLTAVARPCRSVTSIVRAIEAGGPEPQMKTALIVVNDVAHDDHRRSPDAERWCAASCAE